MSAGIFRLAYPLFTLISDQKPSFSAISRLFMLKNTFSSGAIFIKSFSQNYKNIKHSYIDGKHSRNNRGKMARTCRALKIKMSFSAPNCPINDRNSRKFEFLFFTARHKTVRWKFFLHKTYPIDSRRSCESFSPVPFFCAHLKLQACEAFRDFCTSKIVKNDTSKLEISKTVDFQKKLF
jgi:hypothetical protein